MGVDVLEIGKMIFDMTVPGLSGNRFSGRHVKLFTANHILDIVYCLIMN